MAQRTLQPDAAGALAVPASSDADSWRTTASADGTTIAWRRDGLAGVHPGPVPTPVVLCNGIACSTGHWSALAELLVAERPVVRWDYRGHGRSGAPTTAHAVAVADVARDLAAVLSASETQRAVIVGHSFGVQVALEAARRWPDRVAAVVAVAGASGAPLPASAVRPGVGPLDLIERVNARTPDRAGDAWRAWWRSPALHVVARAIGGTSRTAPPEVMRSYFEHVSTRDIGVLLAMMRAMQRHDASDVVRELSVPLLALAGGADRLTPVPVMARLALAAPNGELAVCHGGSHTLPAERPEWVVGQMQPLLHDVDNAQRPLLSVPASA